MVKNMGYKRGEMPILGQKKYGRELNFKDKKHCFVWAKCPNCQRERWVCCRSWHKDEFVRCHRCAMGLKGGANHPNWKGGVVKHTEGYTEIWLDHRDFFYPMVSRGSYVAEHRLVMARHLGRCLLPWEVVHHRNGIRTDNRLENLQLLNGPQYHIVDMATKAYIRRLENKIRKLEARKHGIKEIDE